MAILPGVRVILGRWGAVVKERAEGCGAGRWGGADVVFTCLPNDAIVLEVYLGADGVSAGARSGLVTCDCSTVSPAVTVEISGRLGARGVSHMDTPMLGSKPQAVDGQIFFIVGGAAARVARIAPYLAIMGQQHMYAGPSGTGNHVKLIHNGLAAVT